VLLLVRVLARHGATPLLFRVLARHKTVPLLSRALARNKTGHCSRLILPGKKNIPLLCASLPGTRWCEPQTSGIMPPYTTCLTQPNKGRNQKVGIWLRARRGIFQT
jgi:hypothetical protein